MNITQQLSIEDIDVDKVVNNLKDNNDDLDQAFIGDDYCQSHDYHHSTEYNNQANINVTNELLKDDNIVMEDINENINNNHNLEKSEHLLMLIKKEQETHMKSKKTFEKSTYFQIMKNLNNLSMEGFGKIKKRKIKRNKRKVEEVKK